MRLDIFSLFPESFDWLQTQRPVQNALKEGNELRLFNYRDTTPLTGRQVDDSPYGGGAGMVLRVDVIDAALQAAYGEGPRPRVVLLTPTGRLLDDELADELVAEPHVALLCGRYVLAGGELPAMVVADVIMRKLPGALGNASSAAEDSYSQVLEGMPEYPHYTRPPVHRGWKVPEVLVSGDHERIRQWRLERSRERAEAFAEEEQKARNSTPNSASGAE